MTKPTLANDEIAKGGEPAAMLDVDNLAALLSCSTRHVIRMADSGRMPAPIKLGSLRRWQRSVIERWIDDGCPVVRRR